LGLGGNPISVQLVRVEISGEKFHTIICAKNADDYDWEAGEEATDEIWVRFGEGGKILGLHRSEATVRNAVTLGEWAIWSVGARKAEIDSSSFFIYPATFLKRE
jgi:hypothetical protein